LNDTRYHELKASGDLPSPTGTALRLMELIQRDDSTVTEIARVLATDPALTGRLLKFANSPFVGRRRPTASIPEAVSLVGLHVVHQLVLGLSVLSHYRDGRCRGFDYGRYWAGSLATAVAMQALCARERGFPPEEAFTCGLLSGVGRLALATVYPSEYAEILDTVSGPQALLTAESARFLINHQELTAAMLGDWSLPQVHVQATAGLYDLNTVADDNPRVRVLATALNLGARIAEVCVGAADRQAPHLDGLLDAARDFDLDEKAFTELFDRIVVDWRAWGQLLEVTTDEVPPFAQLLERTRNEALEHAATPFTDPGEALRVLAVDDDATMLKIVEAHLTREGHTVATATNGRDGLRIAMEFRPHVIVTDWLMPEMDGMQFCKALRATREGQRIYVIVLTAQESEEKLVEAFAAGADDYIVKPVMPRALLARLRGGERLVRLQKENDREREENRQYLAELALANRRLEQAALTDVLTGLPNRRHALRRLEQSWSAASRTRGTLTVMLIDIDHFKVINDTYGHILGDRVLTDVAGILWAAARTDDEVCRVGGEEFMVICAVGDATAARLAAERLRAAVEHSPPPQPGMAPTTVSIGVAVLGADEADTDRLIRTADTALYQAKRDGRNRVVVTTRAQSPSTAPT
jgi:diguanylate cyclase (GGDEF)-like protein